MAPVAVREPLVFTVRLLAAPLADPVTMAIEMISLPPSAKVMVTPEFSTNEPGLLMDARADFEAIGCRDYLAQTSKGYITPSDYVSGEVNPASS